MKSAPAFDLVALGDPVLDVVVRTDELPRWDDKHLGLSARLCAGGSEANAACAASRLGLRVTMFGQLGDGAACDFLLSELERFGVESTWLARRSGAATATAIIHVGDGGERAITYVPVHDDRDRSGELHTMLNSTRCVYHVPYDAAALERLAAAARTAGTTIVVDVERAVAASPGVWSGVAGCADLIFLNESGFAEVTGRLPTLDAARALHRATGARALVVTLGALGALAVDDRDAAVAQGAFQSRVIDATGAGDCFNGAFVAAFLQGAELPAALAQGCAAACLCVESPGARAPALDAASVAEIQRLRPTVPIEAALEAPNVSSLLVFGSINLDVAVRVPRLPQPGETRMGGALSFSPGGKGANQAHAAARYGAAVRLVGAVGDDDFAAAALARLARSTVDSSGVRRVHGAATGVALIQVADDGENTIVVAAGANDDARAAWVSDEVVAQTRMLLLQLEVPPAQSLELARRVKACGGG